MGPRRIQNTRPGHLILRRFRDTDRNATYRVFYDAVHHGTSEHYSPRDRAAWAACEQAPENWAARLSGQITHVVETEGRIGGFMSLTQDGHLDMAFVLPHLMGTGVADRLYAAQEDAARDLGLTRITTDASHLARSFFLRHGWTDRGSKLARSNGHDIENFAMDKELIAP